MEGGCELAQGLRLCLVLGQGPCWDHSGEKWSTGDKIAPLPAAQGPRRFDWTPRSIPSKLEIVSFNQPAAALRLPRTRNYRFLSSRSSTAPDLGPAPCMLCNYKLIAEMNFLLAPGSSTDPPLSPDSAPRPRVITPHKAGPSRASVSSACAVQTWVL